MPFRRDQMLNRFGQLYRGRGNKFTDFMKKVLRTGAKTTIEKGGELVGKTLKNSSNPAFQVLGHVAANASKGAADALSSGPEALAEPVKAINVKGDVEQEAKTTGTQQVEQMTSKRKSSRRAKGVGGPPATKRRRKEAALWDIWNC